MSLGKQSAFYYGFVITSQNQNFPFDEGNGEINALVQIGNYSLDDFTIELTKALNAIAVNGVYTVSVDRQTRRITISSTVSFNILIQTGSTIGSSCLDLAGFTGLSNTGNDTSHTGRSAAGFEYVTQFTLQDFIDKENYVESNDASVNITTNGDVEVLRFGLIKFYELNIKFITNLLMDDKVIRNNRTGVEDAQAFLRNITQRVRFEIMPDASDRSTFDKVILEQISGNSTATGFRLRELYNQNLPGFFETGVLRLRVVP